MTKMDQNQGGHMKVFISHSWRDKTIADMLTQDLSSMVDVWLDIQNLRPGDSISPSIDGALAEMDIVVALWSRHSAFICKIQITLDNLYPHPLASSKFFLEKPCETSL